LSGGKYVANGGSKCVVDADDEQVVCRYDQHDQIDQIDHDQYVKVVLPRREFDKEVAMTSMLRKAIHDDQHMLTVSIADNVHSCVLSNDAVHMVDVKNQKTEHCGVGKYKHPTQLVVVMVRKLQPFVTVITKRNVHLIYDVLHALYQFAKHGYAHLDVKRKNVMLDNGVAKLIDFGWTRSYSQVLTEHNKTFAGKPYPYWPTVLSSIARLSSAQIAGLQHQPDQLAELMQASDKFGFAMMLLQTKHKSDTLTYHVKKPSIDMFQMITTGSTASTASTGNTRQLKCSDYVDDGVTILPAKYNSWDVHFDCKFYSWKQIYANLQACFGVPGPDLDDYHTWLAKRQAS
jgi:hypothetical protein